MFPWSSSSTTPSEDKQQPETPTVPSTTPEAADARLTRSSGPSIQIRPSATEAERFEEISRQAEEAGRASGSRLQPPQPRDIARERLRRRSPSPSSTTAHFEFPTMAMYDEEAMTRMISAAVRAASEGNLQQVQSLRKPELPPFDKANIEIWIKRVESAYARVRVTDPKIKFAHLESKLGVDLDPKINDFLFGEATEDTWREFLDYLRSIYGRTKKQATLALINGIPREGRRPSQLLSVLKDKTKGVTIDDILKEQLFKEMPHEVQRQLTDKVEDMTVQQLTDAADKFFDKDGKLLVNSNVTSVSSISSAPPAPAAPNTSSEHPHTFPPLHDDADPTDVNAVRFKQGQRQNFPVRNGSSSAPRGRGGARGGSGNSGGRGGNSQRGGNNQRGKGAAGSSDKKVCQYHVNYGPEARKCESYCTFWPSHPMSKGKASQ